MVLRNGRPNDILSVSRNARARARANSTSQSTALFSTVILAGCATLAICIGKSCGTLLTRRDATRCASCRVACKRARMHACIRRVPDTACAYDFRCVPCSRGRREPRGPRRETESILGCVRGGVVVSGRLTKREVTWRFFCHDRSYYSWFIRSPRLHLSLAGQIKRA